MDQCNVFIFTKIEKNRDDRRLLERTFEQLDCKVKFVGNAPRDVLEELVEQEIIKGDFSKYEYVVIMILDDENESCRVWKTTDDLDFHINQSVLTPMLANQTIKCRLVIFQANCVPATNVEWGPALQLKHRLPIDIQFSATSYTGKISHKRNYKASAFIKILCEELERCAYVPRNINDVFDDIAKKLDEMPMRSTPYEGYMFGRATVPNCI